MALNDSALVDDLTAFLANVPPGEAACAAAWAEIMGDYASGLTPPSAAVAAASAALEAGLAGMSGSGAASGIFASAFSAFGSALAGGMAPPGVPPGPFNLSSAVIHPPTGNPATAAASLGAAIGAWIRTGITGPPTSVPWS